MDKLSFFSTQEIEDDYHERILGNYKFSVIEGIFLPFL